MASTALSGQALQPTFEVASLKPSGPEERIVGMFACQGGRIAITCYTLKMLIHEAYGIQDFQISGGPAWVGETRYSVVAMPPADSKSS